MVAKSAIVRRLPQRLAGVFAWTACLQEAEIAALHREHLLDYHRLSLHRGILIQRRLAFRRYSEIRSPFHVSGDR